VTSEPDDVQPDPEPVAEPATPAEPVADDPPLVGLGTERREIGRAHV